MCHIRIEHRTGRRMRRCGLSSASPSSPRKARRGGAVAAWRRPSLVEALRRERNRYGPPLPDGISGTAAISWGRLTERLDQNDVFRAVGRRRAKLLATEAAQRHLVLGVTSSSLSDIFFALDDYKGSLPERPPFLPSGDHAPLAAASGLAREMPRVFPGRRWFDPSGPLGYFLKTRVRASSWQD